MRYGPLRPPNALQAEGVAEAIGKTLGSEAAASATGTSADKERLKILLDGTLLTENELSQLTGIPIAIVRVILAQVGELKNHRNLLGCLTPEEGQPIVDIFNRFATGFHAHLGVCEVSMMPVGRINQTYVIRDLNNAGRKGCGKRGW